MDANAASQLFKKYGLALGVIEELRGNLDDDTYLEKLITQTRETIDAFLQDGNETFVFRECGLQDFSRRILTGGDQRNDLSRLQGFVLKMLTKCIEEDDSDRRVTQEAKRLCETLLSDKTDVTSNVHFLKFLDVLVSKFGGSWALHWRVWKEVIAQHWHATSRHEERSLYWKRALTNLTITYIITVSDWCILEESDLAGQSNGEHLQQVQGDVLSCYGSNDDIARYIIPAWLKHLLARSSSFTTKEKPMLAELQRPLQSVLEQDTPTQKNIKALILFWALTEPEQLTHRILRIFSEPPNSRDAPLLAMVLQILPYLVSVIGLESVRPVCDYLINLLSMQPDSQTLKVQLQVLKYVPNVIKTEMDLQEAFLLNVTGLVMNITENFQGNLDASDALVNRVLDAALTCFDVCQIGIKNGTFHLIWELTSSISSRSEMSDSIRILALKNMTKWIRLRPAYDSIQALIPQSLWNPLSRQHWGIQDAFLELLTVGFETCESVGGPDFDSSVIYSVLDMSLRDSNSFVRASSLECLAAMSKQPTLCRGYRNLDLEVISQKYLIDDTEAVVRRSATKVIRSFLLSEVEAPLKSPDMIIDRMLEALLDFDCETRMGVLQYWLQVATREVTTHEETATKKEHLWQALQDKRVTTALAIAMDDYELTFLGRLLPIIGRLKMAMGSDCNPDSHGNDVDRLPTITPSTKVSGDEFLHRLSQFDLSDARARIDNFCSLHMGLDSVLSDIIQSVSEDNELDGIDCV